ncbi:MAG TPA: vitamin K epoxide reductase family protein [Candidatus Saccharimonadales bacterium]|nr:vitamin K epoxide reductase family protein [Candidatus Saccharimonadales bacterium]
MAKVKAGEKLSTVFPWLILIAGIIGVLASLILSIEKIDTLKNPHYVPVCNLNPIFSCSTVSGSDQAEAFGFYNPFLGLAGFAAVATVGSVLLAGARLKKWFWRLFQLGMTFAIVFITWLQYETLYRIGALCLFCMVTWAVTIPAFWYTTLYNLDAGHLTKPKRLAGATTFARRHHLDILIVWYLIIIALVLKRFWYYFGNF